MLFLRVCQNLSFPLTLIPQTISTVSIWVVIDERIQKIRPPPEFRRSPRSVTCMKQWKASEHRAWLLYYALPVLSDLLPPDYIYAYSFGRFNSFR